MSAFDARGYAREHIGELAELHALGMLEQHERVSVEAHVERCSVCARMLAQAQETVALLDAALVPQSEPPRRLAERLSTSARLETLARGAPLAVLPSRARPSRSRGATAAALLLAAGIAAGAAFEGARDARSDAGESAVVATLATSHFDHVGFRRLAPSAPAGKVLYARDGSWFYVVIDSATCDCRVFATSAAGGRDFGRPPARGTTATLFVRDFPRPTSLALLDPRGTAIAGARLVYRPR